jgi:hypothetical protein
MDRWLLKDRKQKRDSDTLAYKYNIERSVIAYQQESSGNATHWPFNLVLISQAIGDSKKANKSV